MAELMAIEGIVILDRTPNASIIGVGSGVVCLVAEFENGPYKPTEVFGGQDIITQFGGFGFNFGGIGGNNPCARARKSDGASVPEYWNGNGYVALAGKSYPRLILVRVDTTVGEVTFTRLAYLVGDLELTHSLNPGQILTVKVDGSSHNVTWDAAAAAYTGGAGSYPYAPAGGETITIETDVGTPQHIGPVVVTLTSGDTTQNLVMSRINTAVGYDVATDGTGGKITLTSRVKGTGGHVIISQITSATATATGLAVHTENGTGDVADITSVTFTEVKARIEADATGSLVEKDAAGSLMVGSVATTGTPSIEVVSATTTVVGAFGLPLDSQATPVSTGKIETLLSGTQVTNTAISKSWSTAQDVAITAAIAGPYKVRVRPTLDDGTVTAANPGDVTTIGVLPTGFGMWHVTNTLALVAALSESAIDAAYITAIDATKNPNSIAKQDDIIVSARQSNAIRNRLRANALDASSRGLSGRSAIIRPPLGTTTRAMAKSDIAQPGVGSYRNDRVWYAYPGGNVNIPQIAALGLSGGDGFTADGNIDVGSDTWLAAVCASLAPEEDPGQVTTAAANLLSLEVGNPDVQALIMEDYESFKASGIIAPRFDSDDGVMIFQSGITSVDPLVSPGLVNIARRRMADFIQDSLAIGLSQFTKKMNSRTRRALVIAVIEEFLSTLVSKKNADKQRIDSYLTNYRDGNTPDTLAAGLFRPIIKVRTLSSFKVIVLDTEIGEGVLTIQQAA